MKLSLFTALVPLLPSISAIPASSHLSPRQQRCIGDSEPGLWVVENLEVEYTGDEVLQRGNATFTLTNTNTEVTDTLRCSLRANYICEFYGIPSDPNLDIWLQLNLNVASFTLNKTLPDCLGPEWGDAWIVGQTELYLECPQEWTDKMVCQDDGIKGVADGDVVLPEGWPNGQEDEKREVAAENRQDGVDQVVRKQISGGGSQAEHAQPHQQTERRKTRPVQPVGEEEAEA
ncbi:hypothetical protein QC763_310662 [Podospora pseudopauciseta]|uniref:AA1-like domain-containing protein n=2 Tax=Podospora TaxID=5144 RepID=A0ABR0HHX3_9PEZI|nr:hypothetical protein QC763_310662 [Podospora pseudopauciseta]KAK4678852.1 hypothetical protein QC764_310662 [Podospora pseudoanserina]